MSASSSTPKPSLEESRPEHEAARPASFNAVPGWMISGMLHAGVIVFLITSGLPSCGDGQIGTGSDSGEFREVGIYVKQPSETQTPPKETDDAQPEEPQSAQAGAAAAKTSPAAEAPAAELIDLPDIAPHAVIGQSRSTPAPGGLPLPSKALVTPNGSVRSPPPAPGQGPGNVSFMGHTTEAQTVVYVIDTSSSMGTNNALEFAQAKLKQSINGLGQKQQFQIISYTDAPVVMRLRNDRSEPPPLYRAIGPNLTLATQYINGFRADSGTNHQPALLAAFQYKPDVIFFLTDAEEGLSPKQLSKIKTEWNKQGKTHVHCVQFGTGPDLKLPSTVFLRTLASQNGGSYTYINIEKL